MWGSDGEALKHNQICIKWGRKQTTVRLYMFNLSYSSNSYLSATLKQEIYNIFWQ